MDCGVLVVDVELGQKPRNSKFKQKLKTIRKEHNKNKNIEQHYLINYRKNDLTANSDSLFVN